MAKPLVTIIVAMSENHVIGKNNVIPWHIKEDLLRFRTITTGKTIIVGRTTFEMIKKAYAERNKPLPDRKTIVITSNPSYKIEDTNCYVVHSLEEAIQKAKNIEKKEVFVAGGASIYKQAITIADKLDITVIHTKIEGDATFPEYKNRFKNIVSKRDSSDANFSYTFYELTP